MYNNKPLKALLIITLCFIILLPEVYAFRYSTLRPGNEGVDIKNMQSALYFLNFPISVDGKYGPQTQQAVLSFQRANKLTADGLAGNQTLSRLYSLAPQYDTRFISTGSAVSKPVYSNTTTNINTSQNTAPNTEYTSSTYSSAPYVGLGKYRMGDESNNVRLLQQRLNELGYDAGRADAVFGRKTYNALKEFQKQAGLRQDGIAGQDSFDSLFAHDAPRAALVLPEASETATIPTEKPAEPIYTPAPQAESTLSPQIVTSTAKVDTPNRGTLNLRPEPKKRGRISSIPNGTLLNVLSKENTWCKVSFNGTIGYVMTEFLNFNTINSNINTPTIAPEINKQDIATEQPTNYIQNPDTLDISTISRPGDKGDDVKILQARLLELGYSLIASGIYDDGTKSAVMEFQRINGLVIDGIAGANTKSALYSAAVQKAGETPISYTTLKLDQKSEAIGALNRRLKELGYNVNTSDSFDIKTHQAVTNFQIINGLNATGSANPAMQRLLYSDDARPYDASYSGLSESAGRGDKPSTSSVKLLHWYKDIKPSLGTRQTLTVYHPGSGISFKLRTYSLGEHADSEPLTLSDTQLMNRAFGPPSWNANGVYVKLPNGTWTVAAMHNRPHLSGSIPDNGFDGHLCVHFLRDMEETKRVSPNYGVTNQNVIRKLWKSISGEELDY